MTKYIRLTNHYCAYNLKYRYLNKYDTHNRVLILIQKAYTSWFSNKQFYLQDIKIKIFGKRTR